MTITDDFIVITGELLIRKEFECKVLLQFEFECKVHIFAFLSDFEKVPRRFLSLANLFTAIHRPGC